MAILEKLVLFVVNTVVVIVAKEVFVASWKKSKKKYS